MESCPAENGGEGEAKEHGVKENETADGCIRILAKDHKCHEPDGGALEVELSSSEICKGNTNSSEEGIECTHEGVVQILGVFLSGFEFEGAIVACEISGQADEHLSKRRVNIEVEFALQVMRSELSKTGPNQRIDGTRLKGIILLSFVPCHNIR